MKRAIFTCALLLGAAASPELRAQASLDQAAAAKALYEHALTRMAAGDFASACPQIEEAIRIEPRAVGARLTLGECYARAGRLASAWSAYALAEQAAIAAGQADRQRRAAEEGAALAPRLARLVILVPNALRARADLRVSRDGAIVGAAQWGVPIPVDRGRHEVAVSLGGQPALVRSVEVLDDGVTVSVTLPDPPRAAPEPPRPADTLPPPAMGPLVRVHADKPGVALMRGAHEIVCRAPCAAPIIEGQPLFFGGEGIPESPRFKLPATAGDVRATVSAGSTTARAFGLAMVIAGVGAAVTGGAVLAAQKSTVAGTATLGAAAGAALIGVSLVVANGTSFTLTGAGGAAIQP